MTKSQSNRSPLSFLVGTGLAIAFVGALALGTVIANAHSGLSAEDAHRQLDRFLSSVRKGDLKTLRTMVPASLNEEQIKISAAFYKQVAIAAENRQAVVTKKSNHFAISFKNLDASQGTVVSQAAGNHRIKLYHAQGRWFLYQPNDSDVARVTGQVASNTH